MSLSQTLRTILEVFWRDKNSSVATKTAQNVKAIDSSAEKAKRSINDLAGAFTGLFAARLVKQGFEALLKPTMEMEESMTRLAMITNLSKTQLGDFRAQAFKVAGMTPFGPQEVTQAMMELQRATGDAGTAFKALEGTATLSMVSMGKLPLERTAKMMGELARTFGFKGEELGAKAGMIFAAAKASGVGIENYEKVMGRLGVAAMQAGQSFDDMLVAFTMTKRIIPSAQRASQQMMMLMAELTKPGSEKAFRDIGVDIKNAEGGVRSLKDIMLQLDVQRKKTGDAPILETIGGKGAIGKRSIKPVLAMLRSMEAGIPGLGKGADAWNNLQKEMANSSEQMTRAKEQFLAMHGASVRLLKEALIKIAITLGDQLLPTVGAVASALKRTVEAIDEFIKTTPGVTALVKGLMIIGAVTAGFWAFRAAMYGATALFKVVQTNLMKATTSSTGFAASIRASTQATIALSQSMGIATTRASRMGITMVATGQQVVSSVRKMASGARTLAKDLVVLYAIMEGMELISNPSKYLDSKATWFYDAAETWSSMMPGSQPRRDEDKDDAKRLAEIYRKQFGISMAWENWLDPLGLMGVVHSKLGIQTNMEKAKLILAEQKQVEFESRMKQQYLDREKENIKSMLDAFRFGSNNMNAVADRFDTIMGYKPKIFSEQAMGNANLAMSRAAKKTRDPNDVIMIQVAQAMLPIIKSNMDLAQRGILGASGLATTKEMMADRFALLTHLSTKGLVTKGTLEGSRKNMGAVGQMGTKGNLEFGRRLHRLGGNALPQGKGGEYRTGPDLDPTRLEGTPAYREFYQKRYGMDTSGAKEASKSPEQSVSSSLMSLNATLLDVQMRLDKFWGVPEAAALASNIQGTRKALEATTPWISSIAGEIMKSDPIKALGKLGSALFGD